MKKLILHVGTHKTGTTSLQSFFSLNEGALLNLGIAVPRFSQYQKIGKPRNGLFLSRGARFVSCPELLEPGDEERVSRDLKAFEEALSQNDAVLLSDESIWYEGSWKSVFWRELKRLVDLAGVDRTTVVVYLRRQDEYACSYWRQAVKSLFSPTSLGDLLRNEDARACRTFDYRATLASVEEHFGRDAISVRVYDRGAFAGGDIYHDFCAAAGIPWQEDFCIPDNELNPSFSDLAAELKRWANASEAYSSSSDFLRGPASSLSMGEASGDSMKLLTRELYEQLRGRFSDDNAYIAERYLNGNGGKLTEWPPYSGREWDASSEEIPKAIVQLFAEAMARQEQAMLAQKKEVKLLQKAVKAQEEMLLVRDKAIEDLQNRISELEEVNRASLVARIKRGVQGAR